jgi:indolepyruvate ferredoxin oxidoreductase
VADAVKGRTSPVKVALTDEQRLNNVIAYRTDLLRAYQDDAYAEAYRNVVARVRRAEQETGYWGLALAVAENLAKLMAYKDEYEVARLFTDGAFQRKLGEQFDGKLSLSFHMAPPILSKLDPITGEPQKREFGAWILPVLKILAKGKRFRGTRFDLFGRSVERQTERQLIKEYLQTIETILANLSATNHAIAIKLARIPEDISGFGHIKERSVHLAKSNKQKLMGIFLNRGAHSIAEE